MMKSLFVTLGFLAATTFVTCRDDNISEYIQYFKEISQSKKLCRQFANLCPDKDDEIDEAVLKAMDCFSEIDENAETTCSIVKNHFLPCAKPIIDVIDSCVPDESRGVTNLILQSFTSGVAYTCRTDGEHIIELIVNDCFFKTDYSFKRCQRRIKTKLQQYKNKPPTKNDICELARSMKPCLHSHMQNSCGNMITREAFMGLFDAMTAPCNTQVESNEIDEIYLRIGG